VYTLRDVAITGNVFARLIGRQTGNDVLLFEVSGCHVTEDWSEPVQYRFVRTEGGLMSLEIRPSPADG
jgi:hypothetical protein